MARAAGAVGVMGRLTGEELAAWVTASCQAQGVPTKVTDPHVLGLVGTLLTGRAGRTATARSAGGAHRPAGSQPPGGDHPGGVQLAGTQRAGTDLSIVQDSPDDRVLPSEVQPNPRSA